MIRKEKNSRGTPSPYVWLGIRRRTIIADLLGDEKAVAPLIKFLKATGIGRREGARERESWSGNGKTNEKARTFLNILRRGNPNIGR